MAQLEPMILHFRVSENSMRICASPQAFNYSMVLETFILCDLTSTGHGWINSAIDTVHVLFRGDASTLLPLDNPIVIDVLWLFHFLSWRSFITRQVQISTFKSMIFIRARILYTEVLDHIQFTLTNSSTLERTTIKKATRSS